MPAIITVTRLSDNKVVYNSAFNGKDMEAFMKELKEKYDPKLYEISRRSFGV